MDCCQIDYDPRIPGIAPFEVNVFEYVPATLEIDSGWSEFLDINAKPNSTEGFYKRILKNIVQVRKDQIDHKNEMMQLEREKMEQKKERDLKEKIRQAEIERMKAEAAAENTEKITSQLEQNQKETKAYYVSELANLIKLREESEKSNSELIRLGKESIALERVHMDIERERELRRLLQEAMMNPSRFQPDEPKPVEEDASWDEVVQTGRNVLTEPEMARFQFAEDPNVLSDARKLIMDSLRREQEFKVELERIKSEKARQELMRELDDIMEGSRQTQRELLEGLEPEEEEETPLIRRPRLGRTTITEIEEEEDLTSPVLEAFIITPDEGDVRATIPDIQEPIIIPPTTLPPMPRLTSPLPSSTESSPVENLEERFLSTEVDAQPELSPVLIQRLKAEWVDFGNEWASRSDKSEEEQKALRREARRLASIATGIKFTRTDENVFKAFNEILGENIEY